VHCVVQPHRRGYRALLVCATTLAAGLGTAGPALATELPAPPPVPEVTPVVAEPATPLLPIPAIPIPELDIEPVVVTQVDAGNIDVSVRVLSPGEDGAATPESAADVVSPAIPPDITAMPEPTDPATIESAAPAGGTNTNVSIRVLSPGDRGDLTQTTGGRGEEVAEAGTESALPQPDPAPASAAPSESPSDSSQYQSEDSRYQSIPTDAQEPWNWVWLLSLDCSGNASSSSVETGHQESLVWSWEWIWEWACSGGEANESSADSGGRASPPAAAEQAPDDQATSSSTSEAALTEPWVWNWTFTLCGETRTISTRAGSGTPLTWTWDWSWTWTCPTAAAPAVQPPPAIGASPPLVTSPPATTGAGDSSGDAQRTLQGTEDPPALTLPTVWLPAFPPGVERGSPMELVVMPPMPTIEVEVAISPVVLPAPTAPSLPSPAIPFPAVGDAAEPTNTSPATLPTGRTITRHARPPAAVAYSRAEVEAHPPRPEPRAHHARPVEQTRAQGERSKRERQQLPLEHPQSHQALGSSSAGGIVPSALLFGFAALTGFIVLAAPALGRRIRLARELSPRSPDQSPIDHPG
jgi:hypothetical protein